MVKKKKKKKKKGSYLELAVEAKGQLKGRAFIGLLSQDRYASRDSSGSSGSCGAKRWKLLVKGRAREGEPNQIRLDLAFSAVLPSCSRQSLPLRSSADCNV